VKITLYLNILIMFVMSSFVFADEITVAVASNFRAPMKKITNEFTKQTGHKVKLAFGSSGKIVAQIKNGAPFHVFFSADQQKVTALNNVGLTVQESTFTYAIGTLVLYSSKEEPLKEGSLKHESQILEQLQDGQFNKLAIANSKLAPYGKAAEQALANLALLSETKDKWVRGENIAQTFQFVTTGNAELGLIALSQIMIDGKITKGTAWIIPYHLHDAIKQDAVLLQKGKNSQAALALLQFMKSQQARAIIHSYGYKTVLENE